jgi:hypothetical protein
MRDLTHPALEVHRVRDEMVRRLYGGFGDGGNGVFRFPSPVAGRSLLVIVSTSHGWEHASVSLHPSSKRCPTWEEMDAVKRRLWEPHEVAMQLHPPVADHLSYQHSTLHLWRPVDRSLPSPPKWMVAPYPGWEKDVPPDA